MRTLEKLLYKTIAMVLILAFLLQRQPMKVSAASTYYVNHTASAGRWVTGGQTPTSGMYFEPTGGDYQDWYKNSYANESTWSTGAPTGWDSAWGNPLDTIALEDTTAPVFLSAAAYVDGSPAELSPTGEVLTGASTVSLSFAFESDDATATGTCPEAFGSSATAMTVDSPYHYSCAYPLSAPTHGQHNLVFSLADAAENSASTSFVVDYDGQGPTITLDLPEHPGLTYFAAWSVADESGLSGSLETRLVTAEGSCDDTGLSAALPLEQETVEVANTGKRFCIRATDAWGNVSAWASLTPGFAAEETLTYSLGGVAVIDRVSTGGSQRDTVFQVGNHLDSASLVVDADGNTLATPRYLPFGEERWDEVNLPSDRGFTNQRHESFGLMDYKARFYSPGINMFASPDTLIPDQYNPLDWNRYLYARANPVKYTDSSGHCIDGITTIICAMAIGAVVSVAVDAFVTTQIEHKEYSWERAGVAALTGALAGGIGAAVIAPLAVATGVVASTTFTGIAGQATRAAVAKGTELVVGATLSAEANIFISSAQRTANQALDGNEITFETYKTNIQENIWTDAGFGALGYGLGSAISKGISSTFPIRSANGPIPGWNNNSVQKIIIGSGQAGGQAVSNSTLLDFLFKPNPPQHYRSEYEPATGF